MTLFFISATLLVLLSMAWILIGVFRSNTEQIDQEAVNITLARERAQTLNDALANGSIDQATYDYEREQLEYDLAADLTSRKDTASRGDGQLSAAILVSVFVPLAAGAFYLQLGDPGAISQSRTSATQVANANAANQNAPALAELLPQMEERLKQQADDIDGWRLLGRSYLSVGEFDKARSAFARAVELDENDAPTLAQMAETVAMTQQGDLSGEPMQFIERALNSEPNNEHAIWLMSIAQQQAGNHEAALQGFDRLITMAAGDPEALATVEQMRGQSVAALSRQSPPDSASEITPDPETDANTGSDIASASIEVSVDLSEQARADVTDSQFVFVYATASDGPPMPLAVSRFTVAELPLTVVLDDSLAMMPNLTLSSFASVTVGARVSGSGNPVAQPGEWFDEATNIITDEITELTLIIDQQTP